MEGELSRLARLVVRGRDIPRRTAEEAVGRDVRAAELLRRPDVTYRDVVGIDSVGASPEIEALPDEQREQVAEALQTDARYAGYIVRQTRDIERQRVQQSVELPAELDYAEVRGLSNEVREKLERVRPADIGQASRIAGMTPAAISLLLVHLKKRQRRTA